MKNTKKLDAAIAVSSAFGSDLAASQMNLDEAKRQVGEIVRDCGLELKKINLPDDVRQHEFSASTEPAKRGGLFKEFVTGYASCRGIRVQDIDSMLALMAKDRLAGRNTKLAESNAKLYGYWRSITTYWSKVRQIANGDVHGDADYLRMFAAGNAKSNAKEVDGKRGRKAGKGIDIAPRQMFRAIDTFASAFLLKFDPLTKQDAKCKALLKQFEDVYNRFKIEAAKRK